jgi:hypothetical protein
MAFWLQLPQRQLWRGITAPVGMDGYPLSMALVRGVTAASISDASI